MYCKYCGKEITDDSKFCHHCGKNLAMTEEKSTDKENRGGIVGQYVVKNKQTLLVYAIWLVLNILLYCFGQTPEYYIKNQHDYFYPFTLNNYTTLFYVGYYDITELIVYVILIPLLLYFYINVLNKPRTSYKIKAKSNTLDYDNGQQGFETFHHDNGVKMERVKHHKTKEKKKGWSLSHIIGSYVPIFLKPLICPFLCPGGVLIVVLFLFMMLILSILDLKQFYTEICVMFFIFVLAGYPVLLLEYLDKDEAEQLFDNQHKRRKIMSFLAKIVIFELMFRSISGFYFFCSIFIIIIECNSTINGGMMPIGILGAIVTFPYIVYKYKKKLDKYNH